MTDLRLSHQFMKAKDTIQVSCLFFYFLGLKGMRKTG